VVIGTDYTGSCKSNYHNNHNHDSLLSVEDTQNNDHLHHHGENMRENRGDLFVYYLLRNIFLGFLPTQLQVIKGNQMGKQIPQNPKIPHCQNPKIGKYQFNIPSIKVAIGEIFNTLLLQM
jgi:hypothetical protein